jgi:hypothetical protein
MGERQVTGADDAHQAAVYVVSYLEVMPPSCAVRLAEGSIAQEAVQLQLTVTAPTAVLPGPCPHHHGGTLHIFNRGGEIYLTAGGHATRTTMGRRASPA